jgi:hypothetical protein
MGRGIIIIVLGVSLITTFLILKLNANSKEGLKTTVDYYELTQSRIIANSGVEIYLEKLRRDKSLTGSFSNIGLMDGAYDMLISGPDSLITVSAVGHFGNTNHPTIVTARRRKMQMPNVNSALYISSNNINLNLNGNVDIDGNDHKMDGSPGIKAPLPGIGVDTPSDSAYVVNNIKPKLNKTIEGLGGPPSVHTVSDNTDWMALTEDFIFSADTVLSTGTYSNGSTFGTINEPIITYANGDVDFTDATGYGVMVVNGDINFSGNFKYYGIVIVYGESNIRCQTIGNNGIYGGCVLVGEGVSVESQGNSKFYYSSEAIELGKLKLKSSRFEILTWWE